MFGARWSSNLWGAMEQREFITLLGHAALYD
jgi:hypothetical protein